MLEDSQENYKNEIVQLESEGRDLLPTTKGRADLPDHLAESIHKEQPWMTAIQLFVPFLLAGFGMVSASYYFEKVQDLPVYQHITEVNILVVALLGLKGNLEMTLASRLSTYANLGYLEDPQQKKSLITGNVALVLCQAVVVGFLASLAAVLFSWMSSGKVNIHHAVLLCASSIITAFCASLVLGIIMVGVVLYSRKFHINPDNIATPIAASLGDLTTLAALSTIASVFYKLKDTNPHVAAVSAIICLLLTPLWAWKATHNEFTHEILSTGWSPVIFAMMISSIGGLVLNFTVGLFKEIAAFQLIINGVAGNLVSVQASRMSTDLHHVGRPGFRTKNMKVCISPGAAFCQDTKFTHGGTARMLLFMVLPGHLIFCYFMSQIRTGQISISFVFMALYLSVAILQVSLLLYITQVMILSMWKRGIDPDNSAIPYLTATGDLMGTVLLGLAFHIYYITDR